MTMDEDIRNIHRYYSPDNLYDKIVRGLDRLGKDLSKVTLDDLQPVDEFHIRGDAATRELIGLSGFTPDMHILDVGCGIGGSTRRLAHETGCLVTGIDLSDEYISVAERLTRLLNMEDRVKFHACSALELPYDDESFDGVWSLQMNMNIEDKPSWLSEVFRILKPGCRAVLYEVCGNKNTPQYFPVPWAQDESMSFLITPESFREVVESVGFNVSVWNDKTELARLAFSQVKKPAGDPVFPELGVYMLVGNDVATKAYNLHRNLEEERVSLIEAVAVKPVL
ncbi:MAG: methyltransferase domain-containing protein [Paracoccaceae bacterium]|nr:methyltransferase domain-containing protein [Paracoccaceae bacterium]